MKPKYSLVFLGLFAAPFIWAAPSVASAQTSTISDNQRNGWFADLRDNVLTNFPLPNSDLEKMDRLTSHKIRSTPEGPRRDLAKKDAEQPKKDNPIDPQYETFLRNALGREIASASPGSTLNKNRRYLYLSQLLDRATFAWDPNALDKDGKPKPRFRSFDSILKELHERGRPYQTLDENGNFVTG